MTWGDPFAFKWLLFVPAILLFLMWDERRRTGAQRRFADPSFWKLIAPRWIPGRRSLKLGLLAGSAVFAIIALARPQWGEREEVFKVTGLDIMVVLDLSQSMEAQDMAPSRLAKSKHWIRSLAERVQGDRLGLIGFAGSAHVVVPLTLDTAFFMDQVSIVSPRLPLNQGTDIGLGMQVALSALERGAETPPEGSGAQSKSSQAIVLITDGEDHEGQALPAADEIRKKGIQLFVVGIGTERGAPIPVRDTGGSILNYKKDSSGQLVTSRFEPKTLLTLAQRAGGKYYFLSESESEVADVFGELGGVQRGELAERRVVVKEERFQFPLAISVLLFLIQLLMPLSSAVRKKATGVVSVALLALFLAPTPSWAGRAGTWGAYERTQKGLKSLESDHAAEAQEEFEQALALEPGSAALNFNPGIASAKRGEWKDAAQSFGRAAEQAREKKDPALESRAFFNKAYSHQEMGQTDEAANAYQEAIQSAKSAKDAQLEARARKNLQLLFDVQEQEKQKQKQQEQQQRDQQQQDQQSQSQNGKDDKQKDSKDKKDPKDQSGDGKDSKDQSDQKNQGKDKNQSQHVTGRKEFKSQIYSQEDAERVLQELANKEKQLQEKVKSRSGKSGSRTREDW